MYVARSTFTTAREGVGVLEVKQGEKFADDHELVRLFPHRFRKVSNDGRPAVEDATAAPGKRRGE